MKFDEFNLSPHLLEALSYMGFEDATAIQEETIPVILNGRDLIACAQTGTGKTAAFVLPILNKITENENSQTNTLVIVPTRELAIQIDEQIQGFAYFVSVSSLAIYGGGDGSEWEQQKTALTKGASIIVATPGKLLSHLNLGYVKFSNIKHLILDEADRMLDMGFFDDIKKILTFLPQKRQNLMFSATMPLNIRQLADQILKNPHEVIIGLSKPAKGVLQAVYLVYENQKNKLVKSLISNKPGYQSILIFTSTKRKVFEIVKSLKGNGYEVDGISSDLEQSERELVLLRFRSKQIRVLVATDLLSRGLDIKDINLIINFDVPGDAEDYVHRIGRTARAEKSGVAITFVNVNDMVKFKNIEKLIEAEVLKIPLPKELGSGPVWMEKPAPIRPVFKSKYSSGRKKTDK